MESVKNIKNIVMRIVAVFAANGLAVIGAGAIAGISTAKAITVAGLTAVAAVIEKLARAFMDDGKLTADEINAAFSTVDKGAKTVADVEVEERQASQKANAVVCVPTPPNTYLAVPSPVGLLVQLVPFHNSVADDPVGEEINPPKAKAEV